MIVGSVKYFFVRVFDLGLNSPVRRLGCRPQPNNGRCCKEKQDVKGDHRKTVEVVRELGQPYYKVFGLIRYGLIRHPSKDASGDLLWTQADIEAARKALAARRKRRPKTSE